MKIPSNIITTGKYTIGDEFVLPNTNEPYIGYYYEINGSFFQGKSFNANAPKIIKKQDSNKLLDNPKTKTYAQLANVTSQQLAIPKYSYLPFFSFIATDYDEGDIRYFIKQLNFSPILIREVNVTTFQSLINNPLYQTLAVGVGGADFSRLDELDKLMPGLKAFLEG
jgi:hypothetical protein